tara:strand:+ start:30 stop:1886 length:1857 start_codon:yes stop_codon:yes gene_type:complete
MAGAYENPRYTGIVDPNAFMNSFNQSFAMFSQIVRQKNIDKSVKDKELQKQKDEREQMYGTWERGIKEKLGVHAYYDDQITGRTREFAREVGEYARANNLSQRELDDITMSWQNRATAYNNLSEVVFGTGGEQINTNNIDRSIEGADEFIQILNDVKNGKFDLGLAFDPETRSVTGGLTLSDGTELSWKEVHGHIQTFKAVDENGVAMNQMGKVNKDIEGMEKNVNAAYKAIYDKGSRGQEALGNKTEIAGKNQALKNRYKELWKDEFDEDMKEGDVSILNKIWHNKMGDKNLFTVEEAKEIGFNGTKKDLDFLNSLDWGDIQKVIQFADKTDISQEQLTELSGLDLDFDQKPGFTQEDLTFANKIINAQKDKVVDFMYNNNVNAIEQLSIPVATPSGGYDYSGAETKDHGIWNLAVGIINDSILDPLEMTKVSEYNTDGTVISISPTHQENLSNLAQIIEEQTGKNVVTKLDSYNTYVRAVENNNSTLDLSPEVYTKAYIDENENWPTYDNKPTVKKTYDKLTPDELLRLHPDYMSTMSQNKFVNEKKKFNKYPFFEFKNVKGSLKFLPIREDLSSVLGLFKYLRRKKGILTPITSQVQKDLGITTDINDKINEYLN